MRIQALMQSPVITLDAAASRKVVRQAPCPVLVVKE
jgi:hypothetical protein